MTATTDHTARIRAAVARTRALGLQLAKVHVRDLEALLDAVVKADVRRAIGGVMKEERGLVVSVDELEAIRDGIEALVRVAHGMARVKGWYDDGPRNFGEQAMLIVSEVAEAVEESRDGRAMTEVYDGKNGKPEGIPIELADVLIRVADLAGAHGMPLGVSVTRKLLFNATRPPKHGKAF